MSDYVGGQKPSENRYELRAQEPSAAGLQGLILRERQRPDCKRIVAAAMGLPVNDQVRAGSAFSDDGFQVQPLVGQVPEAESCQPFQHAQVQSVRDRHDAHSLQPLAVV